MSFIEFLLGEFISSWNEKLTLAGGNWPLMLKESGNIDYPFITQKYEPIDISMMTRLRLLLSRVITHY